MNTNPYAPPSTPVADIASIPEVRPVQVTWASRLLLGSIVIGMVSIASKLMDLPEGIPQGALIAGIVIGVIIGIAPLMLLAYKIWQGRNWARITLLVIMTAGIAAAIFVKGFLPSVLLERVILVIQTLLQVSAVALTFFGSGRFWFARRPT